MKGEAGEGQRPGADIVAGTSGEGQGAIGVSPTQESNRPEKGGTISRAVKVVTRVLHFDRSTKPPTLLPPGVRPESQSQPQPQAQRQPEPGKA